MSAAPTAAQPRFRSTFEISTVIIEGQRRYVLHDPITEIELRLGELEYQIAVLFDGVRTVEEVTDIIHMKARVKRDPAKVAKLRDRLLHFRILEIPGNTTDTLKVSPFTGLEIGRPFARLMMIKLVEINGDQWLRTLLQRLPWLGTMACFNVCSAIVAGCSLILFSNWHRYFHDLWQLDLSSWRVWLLSFVFANLITAVHECGHAIACRAQNVRVINIGWVLHYFLVSAWTRPGRDWRRLSRGGRWVTVLAGPLVSFMFAGLGVVVWRLTRPGQWMHEWSLMFTLSGFIGGALTLMPLHSGDGYVLLTDAIGIPDLRQRSLAYCRYLITGTKPPALFRQQGLFYAAFGVAVTIWRALVMAASLYLVSFLPIRLQAWHAVVGLVLLGALVGKSLLDWLKEAAKAMRAQARAVARGRLERKTLIAATATILLLVPLPANVSGRFQALPGGTLHLEVHPSAVADIAAGGQAEVLFDDEHTARAAAVRSLHVDRIDGKEVFAVDLESSGDPPPHSSRGWAKLPLGWSPPMWQLARRLIGPAAPRLWSWL